MVGDSPAVDNGTSSGAPSEDFEGNPRPSGSGYDIGAYEFLTTGIGPDIGSGEGIPRAFMLSQNYPNPFNGGTVITYSLSKTGNVEVAIYNVLGQRIRTLVRQNQPAGFHYVSWDGRDDLGRGVPTGAYMCQLRMEGLQQIRKMLYTK